jgi:DNA-binding response OmpR family regulator
MAYRRCRRLTIVRDVSGGLPGRGIDTALRHHGREGRVCDMRRAAMPPKILIAEDEEPIRELLAAVLADEGYRVATASDGHAALAALTAERYDLVVSNVMMPRLSGHELAQAMRAHPVLRGVPLILMSAAGAHAVPPVPHAAYIPKPFDLGHLLVTVERVLASVAQ